jgi:polysaccharide pyruvyl transferase WcaK-like protein
VAGLAIGTHADYGLGLARRDEVLIGELGERLGHEVPVLGPQLPPALAKAVVGEADALFGLRLHALIFAVSTGVPCLGVGWEERTTAFLAEHEQSAISTRPPDEDLIAWVDATLPARWSARPRLLSS